MPGHGGAGGAGTRQRAIGGSQQFLDPLAEIWQCLPGVDEIRETTSAPKQISCLVCGENLPPSVPCAMRILIADDHSVLRRGLIQILVDEYPKAEFGEAESCEEIMAKLEAGAWDILILDIFMPGRSGMEALHQVRDEYPLLPVLVLSSAPEEQLGLRVLKAGASGYLNKQTAPEELVMAVGRILKGKRFVTANLAEHLLLDVSRSDQDKRPRAALSSRESEVLQLLVAGKSLKEIASALGLSVKTVSTFHTRIWEKLNVENDVEMVRYALQNGLVGNGPKP